MTAMTATSAQAVHWPFFGGDNGRSGYQPVGEGTTPVKFLYSKTAAGDQFFKTSPLTSTGVPSSQRVIYGTVNPQEAMSGGPANANGRVHVRRLDSGAALGPEEGVKIDDGLADPDVFGPGAATPEPSSVSFAETSGPTSLGQVFAVHNDNDQSATGDIAIAQLDESSGSLVKQQPLAGTDGFSIRSSVVTTGPDPQGGRVLFFIAENGDDERLFRVPITGAGGTGASFGSVTSTADVDADPQASPTLVFLRDPAGNPRPYIAVGTAQNLRTFAVSDLSGGPASAGLGGSVQTATVPIQPNGMTPNPMNPVRTAPVIYVAAAAGGGTRVYRLMQNANEQSLSTAATSPVLGGSPAPALATDQESEPSILPGKVIVTTGTNLYVLGTDDLAQDAVLSSAAQSPGTTGFGQTTAAASGDFVYVTNDEGAQFVLRLDNAQPVAGGDFDENAGNEGDRLDRSGMGQPSLSRSFVQFGSQKGLFVYTNSCGNDLTGTAGNDEARTTRGGDNVATLGGDDKVRAGEGGDCVDGGDGNDGLSGNADRDLVQGMAGDDRVFGREDDDRVSGNDGNDRVTGGPGADRVFGRSGNDRVGGGSGDDGLSGGGGDDRISAGAGNDRAFGRSGADGVSGNAGNDLVVGGPGADRLFGRAGNDRIRARDGRRDRISCGRGRDTVSADRRDRVSGDCERVRRG